MASDLISIKVPPGFFRNGTEYESAGRWYDGNLVRWANGRIKPWGGWRRLLSGGATLTGRARAAMSWRGGNGFRYRAIGTNEKLYIGEAGTIGDLTPVGLVTGRADAIEGPGYGAGPFGDDAYGTQRMAGTVALDAATWSFDTWGDSLVSVLTSDGRLFEWAPALGGSPTTIPNAPTQCCGVLVTEEGHIVALGADGDRRALHWCSQDDNTDWVATETNTAGSKNVQSAGNIVTGKRVGSQALIWTNVDVHVLDYLGPPLVYGPRHVGSRCGAISPNAITTDENSAYWWAIGGFFKYDGIVRQLNCDVQDYIFGQLNVLQRSKIFAAHNSQFREVTWFYPSANSTENDSYVTFNYGYGIWYFGALARTCWDDRGVFTLPIAVDPSGVIFEHETGFLGDGAPRAGIFVQSGPAEIGNGDRIIYSNLMLPDVSNTSAIRLVLSTKTAPQGREQSFGPYPFTPNAEGYVPVRVSGRQALLRVEQIDDADWSLGVIRFKIAGGGKR